MEIIVITLPLLIGLSLCLLLSARIGHTAILMAISPAAGMGVCSLLFFLWSLIFYPRFQTSLYLGLEAFLAVVIFALLWRWRAAWLPKIRPALRPLRLEDWLLGLAFCAALFFFAYRFFLQTLEQPLGGWDAWALWNNRARYLLYGGAQSWRNVFSNYVTHADYPFLLSGFIARGWALLGQDRTFVPVATAGLFTVSGIGLLVAAVATIRDLSSGFLAGILLASLPVFVWSSASQYADIPLAVYYLAALLFIYRYWESKNRLLLLLAGTMSGFALWTKNEGSSFVLAVVLVLGAAFLLTRTARNPGVRAGLYFTAGLLPFLLLYMAFKVWLVPPTDLFEARSGADLARLLIDPARYQIIGGVLWENLFTWGYWRIPFFPALVVFSLLTGFRACSEDEKIGLRIILAILGLTYLIYLSIYLITPHDLAWHLNTSIGRLHNQLLPGLLLLVFLALRSAFPQKSAV